MKNLWIARLKDLTPGGSDDLAIFDDIEAAMDKARFFWHHLTTLEKDRHEVSVECYAVDLPDTATKYEAYECLNDNLCWPDPVYFKRFIPSLTNMTPKED